MNGNPYLLHFRKSQPESPNRPGEHRGVGDIKGEALLFKQATGLLTFAFTLLSQVDIVPTGEAIFLVPLAFAMTK